MISRDRVTKTFGRLTAWTCLVLLLVWRYPLLPSLAACAMALAVGHHTAVHHASEQRRWRFARGHLAPDGLIQMGALVSAATAVHQFGWMMLMLFLAAHAGSLWWFGRGWEGL